MESELECPICCTIKRFTPYFICKNGHNICMPCKEHVTCCPVCRGNYTTPQPTRNFAIERIIECDTNLVLACRFSGGGCDFTGTKKTREKHEKGCGHKGKCDFSKKCTESFINMETHIKECKYRPVPCPAGVCATCASACDHGGCKEFIPAKDVLSHLENDHVRNFKTIANLEKTSFYYGDMHDSTYSNGSDMFKLEKQMVFLRCQMNSSNKLCYIWLTCNSSRKGMVKKVLEATIVGPSKQFVRYNIPMFCIDDTPKEIFECGAVMGLPYWFKTNITSHEQVYVVALKENV